MKKHCINFAQTTTIESLAEFIRPCYGAVLNFNGKVLVTNLNWKGQYEAATYEFIESPDETGLSECECRLNLVCISEQTFKDSGNAIAWCRPTDTPNAEFASLKAPYSVRGKRFCF